MKEKSGNRGQMSRRVIKRKHALALMLGLSLCISLGANVYLGGQRRQLNARLQAQGQRELSDLVAAMADIEVNLQKLMIASGAAQSMQLLGETALLAQHVESGLARLPMRYETAHDAIKFAAQMGQYALSLAAKMAEGGMLTGEDERQIEKLLEASRLLNAHLSTVGEQLYTQPVEAAGRIDAQDAMSWPEEAIAGDAAISYPALIFDGPFSDGNEAGKALGLTGGRITREAAREQAARYAGTTSDQVRDASDSGGTFEAFGFAASTPHGMLSVQVTGVGGHLLWMMPEHADYAPQVSQADCLSNAQRYLADMGFGEMEPCFVQQYDGMIVANFAAVQDGVLLYPDQVKVQIGMDTGEVVGAECARFLMNHTHRKDLTPTISKDAAQQMLSSRLEVESSRLCVIAQHASERLCWGFEGRFGGETYWAFVDARSGEPAQILRVAQTGDGQAAL